MCNHIKNFFTYFNESSSFLDIIAIFTLAVSLLLGSVFLVVHWAIMYGAWVLLSIPVAALLCLIFSYWYNR